MHSFDQEAVKEIHDYNICVYEVWAKRDEETFYHCLGKFYDKDEAIERWEKLFLS